MAKMPKPFRKRFDDGGIVERTFSDDEPVRSRFGKDMLDKARAYTALAREPMPSPKAAAKAPSRAAPRPAPKEEPRRKAESAPAPAPAPRAATRTMSASDADNALGVKAASSERPVRAGTLENPLSGGPGAGTLEDPEYRKKLEKEQAVQRVAPAAMLLGGKALAGAALARSVGKRAAATMSAAAKRAQEARASKARLADMMQRSNERLADAKRAAAAKAARRRAPERPPPRDADEARMSGEGGGFRKGGKVRGHGVARKGFTKGVMR